MSLTLPREFLTPAEAAAIWRVSVPTVYRHVAAGDIPHIRVGGCDGPIRIPAELFDSPPSEAEPAERRDPSGKVDSRRLAGPEAA